MSVTDDIKARLDIVDVVSDTVSLKKSGRSYTGFCPFHSNTKTPSFVVFPDTQTWRCFGACADGGDLFSFVMKREGLDFKGALDLLAHRAGVKLPEYHARSPQQSEERDKLLELTAAAASYFHQLLTTSRSAATTREYLVQRGLTAETIATFQLGYALDEWEALKSHFMGRGYTAADLLVVGLIVERDNGEPGYDRFRHRLMIPIRDSQGQVIGFGARALSTDQVPKYLNSPQTALFDKSATLYSLDLARKHIRDSGQAVIVEGYMDAIQAHQQGANNVVAQMGTALTEAQLKLIAPLANQIVLALDSDTAGNAATMRGLSLARQLLPKKHRATSTSRGIAYEAHIEQEISIAALPPGQDPDDVLREGLEVWQQFINGAVPALDFYEALVFGSADLTTPQGKSAAVRELIPIFREIKDDVEKVARVQRLARKTGLDERLLLAELKSKTATPPRPASRPQKQPEPDKPVVLTPEPVPGTISSTTGLGLEEYCLGLILNHPLSLVMANDLLEKEGLPGLSLNDFRCGENKEIFKSLQLWTVAETPKIETLVSMVGEVLERPLAVLASQWHRRPQPPLENINHDLSMAILRLRLQNVIEQHKELTFLQHEAMDSKDSQGARHYTEMVETYKQERKKLEQTRDAFSLMGQRRAEANRFGQAL
ncbi:MAG: DNA primase [Anaerolineales bacterium]|nr:DNA primase [Anaerolineales bacterium]